MDDGSSKCLLDVISDPSALSEFLRSNNQLLLDGEDLSNTKTGAIQVSDPGQESISHTIAHTSPISSSVHVPTALLGQQTNSKLLTAPLNNSGAQSPFRNNTKATIMSNVSRTFPHIAKPAAVNIPASNMAGSSKGLTTTGGTFQSKKPIPIQPKNQVIRPNTTLPVGMTVHSNTRQTTPVVNQLPMAQTTVRPKSNVPLSVNGADKARISQYQALQPNRTAQGGAQSILTTPPKRIAPKQVLSPPLNPALTIASPMRLPQTNIINKQKVQLPAHLLQAQTTQVAQSPSQLYPQQITNMVRQIAPTSQVTSVQSLPAKPIQHVQQIQQLVQDKLGTQQPAQPQGNQIQQKVFTQAQLQAALKQSQLLAQNSPGQQQNLMLQQQILKQLIQQAQLAQQQKQTDKVQVSVQPNIVQLQQQPITQTVGQTVPNTNVNQQVTMANQIPVGNQQIQMVLPNQQVVTVAQNSLSSNQQTLNRGQNANLNQQTLKTLNVNNKQIPVGSGQANAAVTQPMVIVSQGNFVLQQSGQQLSTGVNTTAGNSISIQLQNLIKQQQQQQQQQAKMVSNSQQVSQAKQVNQNSTVYVQNVVGTQGQTLKTQQVGSPQPVTQQNVILQSKQPLPSSQGTSTTIQQLTPAQVQQLQNLGAVQKVFIIKQPEILQKLGVQGAKQTQTIQITPQQLQALQQMQNQQLSQQKIIIQNNTPGGNKTATTVLSAQQVKQLHALQQQAGKMPQSPQTLIQRQALAQQLQKQLSSQQTPKTQAKMTHVPRILQTSGRQPVATSQLSSKTVTTIKQEPNRGIKRSHPETPEPPKVVTRLKAALYQDQQVVTHPDIHNPFKSRIDAINKLRTYHVYHDPGHTPKDIEKADGLFNTVADQLIKRSEKMIDKYRGLMLEEGLRKEPSSEMVMLYRLYLADERAALAQDKKQIAEDLKALKNTVRVEVPPETTTTTVPQATVKTEEIPKIKQEPQQNEFKAPLPVKNSTENTESELDLLNTSIAMDSLEDDALQDSGDEHSGMEHETSEIDKAVFNMETSASVYFEPVNHLSDSLLADKSVDSPRTSVDNKEAEDCIAALPMDEADEDEDEKEDVTATLALLHSMAEELADIS